MAWSYIPVVLQADPPHSGDGETWQAFRDRVGDRLGELTSQLRLLAGVGEQIPPFYAG